MTGRDPLETMGSLWRAGDRAEALPWAPPEALDRRLFRTGEPPERCGPVWR